MFEDMTYENILADMLSRVTNDVDKREGSVLYDAIAPCAYQLAQTYFYLNNFLDLVSGDTAVGEYLDRVVADYGMTRKSATYAVRKVETTGALDDIVETRWALGTTSYSIKEKLSSNTYSASCEQSGEIGNAYSGTLENIDNVSGVTATLTDIISAGQDEETDDNLRARFYQRVQSTSTSGNIYDYKKWALEVPGVGDARVFPLWDGNGTVKVIIVDENMAIDPELPTQVFNYVETVRPIGAAVTVTCPGEKLINIIANVALDGSRTLEEVRAVFNSLVADYFKDAIFDFYTISYAKIGSLLLSVPGVADYNSLLINNGTANIAIGDVEMPILGVITLSGV